jgi:DUF4097 and DUF4098 domain-containing protein YvlB
VLVTFAVAMLALVQSDGTDTTIAVQRGQRLEMRAHTGEITVRSWERGAVRVRADLEPGARLDIGQGTTVLSVGASGRRGPPPSTDYELTVPAWMPVMLNGVNVSMHVAGVQAPISVETVDGDVDVTGGEGNVSLRSVQGAVTLTGGKGRLSVGSVNSDVVVRGASGEIRAETVNGEIRLERIESDEVDANTVNGDIIYDGGIRKNGSYRFATHNGDVTVTVPEGADAIVSVSSFEGDFESSFPVTLRERRGRRFNFTLGSGSARVDLESFQGTIRLVRPGGVRAPAKREARPNE